LGVRPFEGTAADAQGILEVEHATFDSCPYSADEVVALGRDPAQHIWVAERGERVVGFVVAFPTHSLVTRRWEIDQLAVHPLAQGEGVGSALVARAIGHGLCCTGLDEARGVVRANNLASQRVFRRNSFVAALEVQLLLYRVLGRIPRPSRLDLPVVRLGCIGDAGPIAKVSGCSIDRVTWLLGQTDNVYLVAGDPDKVAAVAELIHVRTLQYEGFWLESILPVQMERGFAAALINAAIEEAKARDNIDEVGLLVPSNALALYTACVSEGFRSIGDYLVFVRNLHT
jgi:ribosomal protein S18 acetylase RimI-like enzyme